MSSHFKCDIQLPTGETKSTGFWTTVEAKRAKALLFVHGFGGNSISTWTEFDKLLLREPKCRERDIIFYGYDGVETSAAVSAHEFGKFLDLLCSRPKSIFDASFPKSATRDRSFYYEDILIIAHSLGAVVSRRALLNAFDANKQWLANVRLALFAPAHNGTHTVAWWSSVLTGFVPQLGCLTALFERTCRAATDLKHGSIILANLRDDMTRALSKPRSEPLCAKAVVWSRDDGVVINDVFPGDVGPDDPFSKKSHRGVCKPAFNHKDPLKVLRRLL